MKDPIIIVGAARSGTNALRDALCSSAEFQTWPCDEINYIWRHGNRSHPTDELLRNHATRSVRNYLQTAFQEQADSVPNAKLVEKTCATSLRVGFAHEVFPDARFVHITRDGRDVVASAMRRWTAPLDASYLLAKARFVPKNDLVFYAAKYLRSRLARVFSSEDRLSWWGPKFEGMDALGPEVPLAKIAALQWERCVIAATAQLEEVPTKQVYSLRYREFVEDPERTLRELMAWLGVPVDDAALSIAAASIHASSVDKWKVALSSEQVALIDPIVGPALRELGIPQ